MLAEAVVWIVFEVIVKGLVAASKAIYRGVRLLAHGVVVLVAYPLVAVGVLRGSADGDAEADGPTD